MFVKREIYKLLLGSPDGIIARPGRRDHGWELRVCSFLTRYGLGPIFERKDQIGRSLSNLRFSIQARPRRHLGA